MSLLRKIRDQLTSAEPLSNILLNTLALASELDNEELRKWARYELDGYPEDAELPAYRQLSTQMYGNFFGGGLQATGQAIPLSVVPEDVRDEFTAVQMTPGIAQIEDMAASPDNDIRLAVPAETAAYFSGRVIRHAACTGAYRIISRGQVVQILTSVKARLLDFVLEMERKYPELAKSDESATPEMTAGTSQIVQNTIYGGNNVFASGHDFCQNVSLQIAQGDLNSLKATLREIGTSEQDLKELEEAIQDDGSLPIPKKLGARLAAWFGGMCQKAASGLLKVGADAAPAIIEKALSSYYGWS